MACARSSSAVVEAPMVAVDGGATALASSSLEGRPPPLATVSANMPFRVGDKLVGHYTCSQGRAELTLTIDELGRGDDDIQVDVTFEFRFPGSAVRPPADGSFRAVGNFDVKTRRLRLRGEEWIDQPPGYGFYGLNGTVNKAANAYNGTVDATGCTLFNTTLERTGAP